MSQIHASSFSPIFRLFCRKGARKPFPRRGEPLLQLPGPGMPWVGACVFLQPGWSKACCRFDLFLCYCANPGLQCYLEASLGVAFSLNSVLRCQMFPSLTLPQRVLQPPFARDLSAHLCQGSVTLATYLQKLVGCKGEREIFSEGTPNQKPNQKQGMAKRHLEKALELQDIRGSLVTGEPQPPAAGVSCCDA